MTATRAQAEALLSNLERRVERLGKVSGLSQRRAAFAGLDLVAWSKRFLKPYLAHETPKSHRDLLDDLARGTCDRIMREDIVGSRGTAKSAVVSLIYTLASAVEGTEPYILLISETATQANLLLSAIKEELEGNATLADAYPKACGVGPVWREEKIILRNGVVIEAVGARKKLRGRRQMEHRPTLVVIDDPEGDDHVMSPILRERTSRWFHGAVMKVGDATTNFVIVANAVHRECLAMSLQNRPSWRHRVWKSIEKYPDRIDLWAKWEALYLSQAPGSAQAAEEYYRKRRKEMDAGCSLLWPSRENLLDLMKTRAEDRTSFEAEKQCNPVNPANCEWGDEYFEKITWFTRWPAAGLLTVKAIAIDPSKGKDAKRGDYSAIIKLGRTADQRLWIQADIKRRDVASIVVDGVAAHLDFRPDVAVCEGNAFQFLMAEDFAEEAERQGHVAEFIPIDNSVKKVVRIRRLTPFLNKGLFCFYDDPGTRLLLEQMRDFPVGSHDDGPDCLEMVIRAAIDTWNARGEASQQFVFDV